MRAKMTIFGQITKIYLDNFQYFYVSRIMTYRGIDSEATADVGGEGLDVVGDVVVLHGPGGILLWILH